MSEDARPPRATAARLSLYLRCLESWLRAGQDRSRRRKVPMHAVVTRLTDDVGDVDRLILDFLADFPFGQRVAAELAGETHQRIPAR